MPRGDPEPGPGGDGWSTAIRFGLLLGLMLLYVLASRETVRNVAMMLGAAGAIAVVFGCLSGTPLTVRNFTYWDEAALFAALCAAALLASRLAPGLRL